jgi:tetratricopeptide (TPR) repeat protein
LGEIRSERAVEPLLAGLGDIDASVRVEAAVALVLTGGERAIDPLLTLMQDSDAFVRSAGAGALGYLYQTRGELENALRQYQISRTIYSQNVNLFTTFAYCGLLRRLGRDAEFAKQMKIAQKLVGKKDKYNWACLESLRGNTEAALAMLKVALVRKSGPGLRRWAKCDLDFCWINGDPRFIELVETDE